MKKLLSILLCACALASHAETPAEYVAARPLFAASVRYVTGGASVNPAMFGAVGNGGPGGAGTDDYAAFNAAIAAKTNSPWFIDLQGLSYKINAGSIVNWSNDVVMFNGRLYTTNVSLTIVTNGGHHNVYRNLIFTGPGTNHGGVITGSIAVRTADRPSGIGTPGNFMEQSGFYDCTFENFDIGTSLGYSDASQFYDCLWRGNRSYGVWGRSVDHAIFIGSHGGFNEATAGYLLPNEFYPVGSDPEWIKTSVAFHFEGSANALTWIDSAAAYAKRGWEFMGDATGNKLQGVTIMGFNSEDWYDTNTLSPRCTLLASNVNGLTIKRGLGQRITAASATNVFKAVLIDCASSQIDLDLGAIYHGTTPQLALYYSPSFIAGVQTYDTEVPKLWANTTVRWLTNANSYHANTARPDVNYGRGTMANTTVPNVFSSTNYMPFLRNNASSIYYMAPGYQMLNFRTDTMFEGMGFNLDPDTALPGVFVTSGTQFGIGYGAVGGYTKFHFDTVVGGNRKSYFFNGDGSPESAVTAPVGSIYLRTDGGASTTLYVKTSGTGNTGWTAK